MSLDQKTEKESSNTETKAKKKYNESPKKYKKPNATNTAIFKFLMWSYCSIFFFVIFANEARKLISLITIDLNSGR